MRAQTLKLTPLKFRGILREGYSLDQIFLLLLTEKGLDISTLNEYKERATLQAILRKQLVNEQYKLLPEGERLLAYIRSKDEDKLELNKRDENTDFDKWWATYPGTDSVIVNKKVLFKGSRSLRNDKDGCRIKFNKIIDSKEYSTQEMIDALSYEVKLKIERSIKERKNILSYMSNSLTYLNQRKFESFIELAQLDPKGQDIVESINGGIVGI